MKYIDAERLRAFLQKKLESYKSKMVDPSKFPIDNIDLMALLASEYQALILQIDSLQQEQQDMGDVSDGYHTFNELYYYRMLYNAAFFNLLPKEWVHKSKRHHTGEKCFGGGWFIVMANLPTGQISNHYELKDWDLFQIPEKEIADEWDGHTPQEAAERIHKYLTMEQPEVDLEKEIEKYFKGWTETDEGIACHYQYVDLNTCHGIAHHFYELGQQEIRHRIMNPEYNAKVVEQLKSEHPTIKEEQT